MLKILLQKYLYQPLNKTSLVILFGIVMLPLNADSIPLTSTVEHNSQSTSQLNLTQEEHEWLQQHRTIRVGVRHSWKPVEYVTGQKNFRGITIDYMNRIEQLLHIQFNKVGSDDIAVDDIDMLSSVSNPQILDNKFLTTNPILQFHHAIYVHKGTDDINSIDDLLGKKVAVFKHGQLTQLLARDYAQIKLYKIDVIEQAFSDMEIKYADAYVGNELVIDYEANLSGMSFLKKVNYVPIKTDLRMAVRKDWPIFISILNKCFTVLEAEQGEILNHWNLSLFNKTKFYLLIGLSVLSVLLGLMLWKDYKLKRALSKQSEEAQKAIWHQAHYDAQTDLPNRMMFNAALAEQIEQSKVTGLPLGLLYIDLDAFKAVNDIYGHAAGDQLIKETGQRIQSCVAISDIVARLGGDEFSVILINIKDTAIIAKITARVLKALSSPFIIHQYAINITSSIGSSIYPNDANNISTFVKSADMAMYAAKETGKNCYQPYTQKMQEKVTHKQQVANDLRSAITNNEFVLHYQPIIDLKTNQLLKTEALIRWQHPTKGLIRPFEFIDIAEETNMIIEIGDWVFKQALTDVSILQQSICAALSISINVSPKQFNADCLLSEWPALLKKHDIAENSLGVEITEGLLLESTENTNHILSNLRKAGVRILIDDFGTGYSSLSYLKKIDADFIKIDKSFVQNLSSDSDDMALCEAIIVMAHKLGLQVIAEGIETHEQEVLLSDMGCDYGQGYLFSKPVPIARILSQF